MEIHHLLRYTWGPFFSRFGRLLPIQSLAIPKILENRNLVVVSPAATGKTEAVVAPVMERLKRERWEGFSVLYITPTRALVNDLYKRLEPPLSLLGVSISRRTGDHPDFKPDRVTNLLLTTPESLDSLISRYPSLFESLRVIIIDELHLYDATYRGDQLRVLIERIKRIKKLPMSYYALSATIYNPQEMGERYIEDFDVVVNRAPREIEYETLRYEDSLEGVLEKIEGKGLKKILFFSNTRRDAEDVVIKLKRIWNYKDKIWVHHGSLNKRLREDVERLMDSSRVGIISATTTLELGIDIGDIDAVVFYQPPPSVTSLLQRMGRGNRKENRILAYGLYRDDLERVFFRVLFEKAKEGWIEPVEYEPKLSVAAQQVLSYGYQKRGVGMTLKSIRELLSPFGLSEEDVRELIFELISRKYLRMELYDLIYPGEKMEGLISRGRVHSNIENIPGRYEVYNVRTGEKIGEMEGLTPTFAMQGRLWAVEREDKGRVFVREVAGDMRERGKVYKAKGYAIWDPELGREIKKRVFPDIQDNQFKRIGNSVYHFLGSIYGYLWAEILRRRGIKAADSGGIYITIEGNAKDPTKINNREMEKVIDKVWVGIKNLLGLGAFFNLLPEVLKREAIYKSVNEERFLRLMGEAEIVE